MSPVSGQPASRNRRRLAPPRRLLIGVFVVGVLVVSALISGSLFPAVLQTAVQGVLILPLLCAAAMLGLLLTAPLARAGALQDSSWPEMFRLILAIGLGLGAISLAALVLGLLGGAYDGPLVGLLLVAAAVGVPSTRRFFRRFNRRPLKIRLRGFDLALLLACVPLAVMLIATTFPAGSLWISEGRGYDVLEYHLQIPREYLALHNTWPLHHNVYSYLPAVMEMLYTVLLALVQLVYQSTEQVLVMYPAQMLHAVLTVLAGAALALAPTKLPSAGRVLAFVLFLSVPWTIVIGSLAYNDGLVLLYGALALGLALSRPSWAGAITLAAVLGLAVGTKMTAGVMVAAPVGAMLLMQGRFKHVVVVSLLAVAVYSPWAIRSMIDTHGPGQWGNPVFPIAAETLGLGHWTPEQAQRWTKGHEPPAAEQSLRGRGAALVDQSVLDRQYSPNLAALDLWLTESNAPGGPAPEHSFLHRLGLIWLVVPLVLLVALSRGKIGWQLVVAGAIQVAAWLFLTHLQARFLLPALLPAALLVALSAEPLAWVRAVVGTAIGLQACCCAFLLLPEAGLLGGPQQPRQASLIGVFPKLPEGLLRDAPADFQFADDTVFYLVGSATPFYYHTRVIYHTVFDGQPLAAALEKGGAAGAMAFLRERHVNYVLINWEEVNRLRRTYGFAANMTPEHIEPLRQHGLVEPKFQVGLPNAQIFKVEP